tara:strand:- start:28323 stop:28700 length:378 start_codon:yes stop_codon:yes gene_type:complete
MLRHIVLLQVASDVDLASVDLIISQMEKAALAVPGAIAFGGGPKKPGSGMSQGFTHGYTIDFCDEKSRDTYLAELDRDHVGRRLSDITVGGLGGILVMNVDVRDIRTPGLEPLKDPNKKPQLRWV